MLAAADGLAARGRLKYRAFISYRRQDATVVARWLRRRLLSFRLPREMLDELSPERRIDAERRVAYFLDTSYQSANEDFWTANIEPALKDTEYLIVLSSPSALQRRTDGSDNWVAREIDTFLKVYGDEEGRQRIIVALAPNAPTESFPGRLGELGTQWDWVDLRTVSLWQWLRPGVADRLSDAFLKVVARLYEIPQHLLPILRREEARRRAGSPARRELCHGCHCGAHRCVRLGDGRTGKCATGRATRRRPARPGSHCPVTICCTDRSSAERRRRRRHCIGPHAGCAANAGRCSRSAARSVGRRRLARGDPATAGKGCPWRPRQGRSHGRLLARWREGGRRPI